MSDLISRSALLDAMNYNRKINADENGVLAIEISSLIDYVEKMPTAYDVDDVAKKLAMLSTEYDKGAISYRVENLDDYEHGKAFAYRQAINIVKRGGIDEQGN